MHFPLHVSRLQFALSTALGLLPDKSERRSVHKIAHNLRTFINLNQRLGWTIFELGKHKQFQSTCKCIYASRAVKTFRSRWAKMNILVKENTV